MFTYIICEPDGSIVSVNRNENPPSERELELNTPPGGFTIDITGQGEFDDMRLLDIHDGHTVDLETKKLVRK